jgi:hypothetical protein
VLGVLGFLTRVFYEVMGKIIFVGAGVITAAQSLKKFPTDRFDQYLTKLARDGILLIEV